MKKRLYKVEDDKKIAGVCGGIAEYFDLDPSIIRLIWALSLLCAGVGFWVYIILAFILPKKSDVE